jgi:hypothetical protein
MPELFPVDISPSDTSITIPPTHVEGGPTATYTDEAITHTTHMSPEKTVGYLKVADWCVTNSELIVTERTKFHARVQRAIESLAPESVSTEALNSAHRDVETLQLQLTAATETYGTITGITKAAEVLEYMQMHTIMTDPFLWRRE